MPKNTCASKETSPYWCQHCQTLCSHRGFNKHIESCKREVNARKQLEDVCKRKQPTCTVSTAIIHINTLFHASVRIRSHHLVQASSVPAVRCTRTWQYQVPILTAPKRSSHTMTNRWFRLLWIEDFQNLLSQTCSYALFPILALAFQPPRSHLINPCHALNNLQLSLNLPHQFLWLQQSRPGIPFALGPMQRWRKLQYRAASVASSKGI